MHQFSCFSPDTESKLRECADNKNCFRTSALFFCSFISSYKKMEPFVKTTLLFRKVHEKTLHLKQLYTLIVSHCCIGLFACTWTLVYCLWLGFWGFQSYVFVHVNIISFSEKPGQALVPVLETQKRKLGVLRKDFFNLHAQIKVKVWHQKGRG